MCHGRTLSLRKPILSMFSTLGTPSAMLRSPSESPIRMMLQYSFSCLKYSVFRRAPSCLLYTWISSPLKPFRTPCEMRSRSNQSGESQDHYVFLKSWDRASTQVGGLKACNNSRCRQSPWSWRRPWRWGGRLQLGGWFPPGRRPGRRRRWRQAHCAAAGGRRTAQSLPWQDGDKQHFSILVVLNQNVYLEGGYMVCENGQFNRSFSGHIRAYSGSLTCKGCNRRANKGNKRRIKKQRPRSFKFTGRVLLAPDNWDKLKPPQTEICSNPIEFRVSRWVWRNRYLSAASDSLTTSDSLSFSIRCSTRSVWDLKYLQTNTHFFRYIRLISLFPATNKCVYSAGCEQKYKHGCVCVCVCVCVALRCLTTPPWMGTSPPWWAAGRSRWDSIYSSAAAASVCSPPTPACSFQQYLKQRRRMTTL